MLCYKQGAAPNKNHNVQIKGVWLAGLGVLEPGSSPHHVDMLLAGAEEPAVALVTGAGSISTARRA